MNIGDDEQKSDSFPSFQSSDRGDNIVAAWRLNGAPLPDGWLPAGSRLEIRQFVTDFGLRGLCVHVVPDEGFLAYDSWQ